ncbi:MAG TPA: DUF177 domain-containing protein [Caulobacteraceae bacterium]|jgi:hypothetical protein|nr:DUF177 domain-containing protein [Caulobacteraceae bacterium]
MELKPVWSHVAAWPNAGVPARRVRLEGDAAARARIAQLLLVETVKSLSADLELSPWLDGLEITGHIDAVVERICGVSLEPFDEVISESVHALRAPPGSRNLPSETDGDREGELPQDDAPEAGEAAGVDLAALCFEILSLALDPYPRKPGAEFEAQDEEPAVSAFAALARLKPTGESS